MIYYLIYNHFYNSLVNILLSEMNFFNFKSLEESFFVSWLNLHQFHCPKCYQNLWSQHPQSMYNEGLESIHVPAASSVQEATTAPRQQSDTPSKRIQYVRCLQFTEKIMNCSELALGMFSYIQGAKRYSKFTDNISRNILKIRWLTLSTDNISMHTLKIRWLTFFPQIIWPRSSPKI